jgi:predicted nucleotidyltransferase
MKENFDFHKYNISVKQIEGFEDILPKLINIAHSDKVTSFWLHGSRAIGTYNKNSDLDIAYIINTDEDRDFLKDELKKYLRDLVFHDYFFSREFHYWSFNGMEVGVHIYTRNEFELKISESLSSVSLLEKHQDFCQHIVLNSLVIHDPWKVFKNSKSIIGNYPENLRKEMVELTLKRVKQEAEWWNIRVEWKSVFEQISVLKPFIDEASKCHYALNGRYCMRSLKQYDVDMRILIPNLSQEMKILTKIDPDFPNDSKKREVMLEIYKKLDGEYKKQFSI